MINLNDVLLAMSNIPVDDPIAEIWGRQMQGGYKIIEYTGTLPITIRANGDALLDYRIYGTDGGVGERTENLFNGHGDENYGYYNASDGEFINDRRYKFWRIAVNEGDIIHMTAPGRGSGCAFYNGEYVKSISYQISDYVVPSGIDEITNNYNFNVYDSAMVTKNQPLPDTYVPYGYKLPIVSRTENLYNYEADTPNVYILSNGQIRSYSTGTNFVSDKIPVVPGETYMLVSPVTITGSGLHCAFYGNDDSVKSVKNISPAFGKIFTLTAPEYSAYFRTSIKRDPDSQSVTMFIKGTTAPSTYIPYSRTDTPVYIGENQLGEDEYVSYSDGKIYKRTENLLNSKIIGVTQKVKIESNTEYVLSRYTSLGVNKIYWSVYNESDKNIYGKIFMQNDTAMRIPSLNNASYIMITIPEIAYDSVSIVKGTFIDTRTAVPATYTPYVSPTDPPVPLPEIPTVDGETVIDYDGDPKPSQMYVKYKDKG